MWNEHIENGRQKTVGVMTCRREELEEEIEFRSWLGKAAFDEILVNTGNQQRSRVRRDKNNSIGAKILMNIYYSIHLLF